MIPITVRLPDDLHEKLRQSAFDQRTSMNALIIAAIRAQQSQPASSAAPCQAQS